MSSEVLAATKGIRKAFEDGGRVAAQGKGVNGLTLVPECMTMSAPHL